MSRLFTDGAEMGDLLFWTSGGHMLATTPAPLAGRYSYYFGWGPGATSAVKSFAPRDEIFFRARLYGLDQFSLVWRAGALGLLQVAFNPAFSSLELSGAASGSTAPGSFHSHTWRLLELHVRLAEAGSLVELRLDGAPAFAGEGPGSASSLDNFLVSATGLCLDDLALNDTLGGQDDAWCGDGCVLALLPAGEGDASDFSGSDGDQADNWQLVSELPSDGDASYVEAAAAGARDLYRLAPFEGGGWAVRRAWVELRARSTGASGEQVRPLLKSGETLFSGAALDLPAAYGALLGEALALNPSSGAPWTADDLNDLQAGLEVV